jgi:WD40 repeat protein
VAFSPDGSTVFSCGYDGTIKVWDIQTGVCVNTLRVEGSYAGMNISGVRGITEAQREALKALGAVEM